MSVSPSSAPAPTPPAADGVRAAGDRRHQILEAAARAFVRLGFHAASMQDIAAEAEMSPGNLYRYFPSKAAIVQAMCERDREDIRRDFATLEGSSDPLGSFVALGRRHLVDEPRERAIMLLEIWAEASRNSEIGLIGCSIDGEIERSIASFVARWRSERGVTAPLRPEEVARLILMMADGMAKARAVSPQFDAEAGFALLLPIIMRAIGGDAMADLSPAPLETR